MKASIFILFLSFIPGTLSYPSLLPREDDLLYTFGSFQYNGQTILRTCAWLTENVEKTQSRKERWCNAKWQNVVVGDKCRTTCQNDEDDLLYTFGSFQYNGQTILRTCAWLTETVEKAQVRKDRWCNAKWQNVVVGDKCRATCGNEASCEDDECFPFGIYQYNGQSILKTCAWISKNAEKTQVRKDRWCNAKWQNVAVGDKCRATCGNEASCSSLYSEEICTMDYPDWYDAHGKKFDCRYYSYGRNCEIFGHVFPNFGMTANNACCVCGGGCLDDPSFDINCSSYVADPSACNGDANKACCACKGGLEINPFPRDRS